jgi:hypothetical protein
MLMLPARPTPPKLPPKLLLLLLLLGRLEKGEVGVGGGALRAPSV